ncbi:MAG: methylmalonyl Co-A mutase-associated GTPase MeaB, partial [Candidatus Zixiibacteriota bacterium]
MRSYIRAVMTTLERFQDGDPGALARIITHVENREPGYESLLSKLYRFPRRAVRIGMTGPPGAGKSTLVDCLNRRLFDGGEGVGVIAVDPSSPFTGGALL